MIREQVRRPPPGLPMLVLFLALLGLGGWWLVRAAQAESLVGILGSTLLLSVVLVCQGGFFIVHPNEGKVLTLFGKYNGSAKEPGLWWVNPFNVRKRISLRVRNFETQKLKVNDAAGNPIEIGAVVVWRVVDTAEALFEVDDFENYVKVQSESAVRTLATSHPYDAYDSGEVALVTHTHEVAAALLEHVQARLEKAGVKVNEARITHLAYAPEIAHAMLQRQQASAIIAARRKIVEGAVGMVENALELLAAKNVLHLDDERKAQMVSNLLVVLCGDRSTQPVVNTGTLYT